MLVYSTPSPIEVIPYDCFLETVKKVTIVDPTATPVLVPAVHTAGVKTEVVSTGWATSNDPSICPINSY